MRFTPYFPRILTVATALSLGANAMAQMGGGQSGGAGMPAFNEPTFRDRLFEAGGIADREGRDGSLVTSVTMEGTQSVSKNYILSLMQTREDRNFDKETFSRDIHALYRTNLFRKIDPYFIENAEGVHVHLVVHERPIIKSVSFLGNERLEDRALAKHAGLQKGDPLDPISINSARGRLIELYQDKGMNQVDVQIRRGLKPEERDVEFVVNEGPVERINTIHTIGNIEFTEEILKTKIKSRDAHYGVTKYIGNKCSDAKLAQDRDTLLGYYRSLGYFDARVDFRKKYNATGDFVDVNFVISEGVRYIVNSVSIIGMERYKPEELLPYMTLRTSQPFLQANKQKDERLLLDVYGAQGHIYCEVEGDVVYQPDHRVDIIYRVSEGDIFRASDVKVQINGDHTKRRVVYQPLRTLRPGQIIDNREIENSRRRLMYSTIFNTDPSRGEMPRIEIVPNDELGGKPEKR